MYTKVEKEQAYSKYQSLLVKFKIELHHQCVLQSAISAWLESDDQSANTRIARLSAKLKYHTETANMLLTEIKQLEDVLTKMHVRFSKLDFETGEVIFSEESLK